MSEQELKEQLAITIVNLKMMGGKIVVKEGWFWRAAHWFVFAITFGSNRRFLTDYYTTLGPFVGVPKGWERYDIENRIAVLEHESIHIRQCKRLGLGNVWVGLPIFGLLYFLLPLPMGLAYFRWRFERAAYVHGINVQLALETGHTATRQWLRKKLIDSAVKQLTTGRYAWTWPFPKSVRAYFERAVHATVMPPSHPMCRCTLAGIPEEEVKHV